MSFLDRMRSLIETRTTPAEASTAASINAQTNKVTEVQGSRTIAPFDGWALGSFELPGPGQATIYAYLNETNVNRLTTSFMSHGRESGLLSPMKKGDAIAFDGEGVTVSSIKLVPTMGGGLKQFLTGSGVAYA